MGRRRLKFVILARSAGIHAATWGTTSSVDLSDLLLHRSGGEDGEAWVPVLRTRMTTVEVRVLHRDRLPPDQSWNRSIVLAAADCYFSAMHPVRPLSAVLPTTLGFASVDDRTRLPGRFFYRLIDGIGLLG